MTNLTDLTLPKDFSTFTEINSIDITSNSLLIVTKNESLGYGFLNLYLVDIHDDYN